eukprot:3305786-Pyramimonas_sp.AAC.1
MPCTMGGMLAGASTSSRRPRRGTTVFAHSGVFRTDASQVPVHDPAATTAPLRTRTVRLEVCTPVTTFRSPSEEGAQWTPSAPSPRRQWKDEPLVDGEE